MRISILTNNASSDAVQQMSKSITRGGHKAAILILDNIKLVVSNNEKGYDGIYYTQKNKTYKISKASLGNAIIPRISSNVPFGAKVIDHIVKNFGVYCPISNTGLLHSYDKMKTLQIVSKNGIRTPKTIMGNNVQDVNYIVKQLGLPVIIKFVHGSLGIGISISESRVGLKTTLQSFSKLKKPFIIQQYIEAGNKDIRTVVMGQQVISAYQRKGRKGDFRANLSQGGSGRSISLSEADIAICIRAAKAIGLEMAGVDLLKDKRGQSYLIEVNANFGFKGQQITGVNFADEMVKFIENKAKSFYTLQHSPYSDKYFSEILPKILDKRIFYVDRANKQRSVIVRSMKDLEHVMLSSFSVNINN